MIHRKWSLLTGPPAILGGIVATVIVANYFFFDVVIFYTPLSTKSIKLSDLLHNLSVLLFAFLIIVIISRLF